MRYLAIANEESVFVEDNASAVAHALAHGIDIAYYAISLDPETMKPTLSERATLESSTRDVVKRVEQISLAAEVPVTAEE